MSPAGIRVLVANAHTIDGQGNHRAPGKSKGARLRWKAECAVTSIAHLVLEREKAHRDAAALASSQGHTPPNPPAIIMAGDLNITAPSLKETLGSMIFDDITRARDISVIHGGDHLRHLG